MTLTLQRVFEVPVQTFVCWLVSKLKSDLSSTNKAMTYFKGILCIEPYAKGLHRLSHLLFNKSPRENTI